ncbi:hypothetical protein [Anaeromyxobacter oryzisoli]|uniref:hypothetical protein n=1 Tax=Anaeromyxobacter oryzisoli TaxID=2925408 RepID=UPI001F55FF4A|nr:hypothetical protein [Anaeromyxobacter sp. SG63]
MSRRRGKSDEATPGIVPTYEGPEVLGALLREVGSPSGADDVVARFQRAQAAGEPRSAVIPSLFPEEPHFATPDDARRLYANLFGLWARLAAGIGAHDDAPEAVPEPSEPPPLPPRGAEVGPALPADLVDAVWRNLAAAPPREVQRRRDRFGNAQPDLAAWLDAVPLPECGTLAAQDLAFEAWVMFDLAFGERLGPVEWRALAALEQEPPPLEEAQPAFAAYVAEQLDVLEGEDPTFGPAERAQVERAVATVGAALERAVREPS